MLGSTTRDSAASGAWNPSAFTRTLVRRSISIGTVAGALLFLTVTFPILALAALASDVAGRRNWVALRTLVFCEFVLLMECLGIFRAFLIWLAEIPARDEDRFQTRNHELQRWWAGWLVRVGMKVYNLSLHVDQWPEVGDRPYVLFSRHVSFVDAFLPVVLLSERFGTRMRYVLKSELSWEPCLDIVGHRVPNVFVRRDSENTAAQINAIRSLTNELIPGYAIVIYPEGTRFTEAKRAHILEKMKRAGEEAYRDAKRFRSTLPPRLSGSLELLKATRGVNAVFCAHTGLESTRGLRQLISGDLIGKQIRVHYHTVPAKDIPLAADAQRDWFLKEWSRLDRKVTELEYAGDDGD